MRFPFTIQEGLTHSQVLRFDQHMNSSATGWNRKCTESIWRRHQDRSNAILSGWSSPTDRRRRLIHFFDEYDREGARFVLQGSHVWVNLTLPAGEVDAYKTRIDEGFVAGGWNRVRDAFTARESWERGDLDGSVEITGLHREDEARGVHFPSRYRSLTLRVRSRGHRTPDGLEGRPWRWFYDVGMRPILPRGEPQYVEPEELLPLLPAQTELGCGPSTEAGVPHLSTLHRIYGVSRPDFSFVFDSEADGLLGILSDPERKYREMTEIYRKCIVAEPTPFYRLLAKMVARGDIVGPVITNNFDCLCAEMGLPELSLRRYDTDAYFPNEPNALASDLGFAPQARTLLVVGVHADRRLAQLRAREANLNVAFIDPEKYVSPSGEEIPYPVEAPQTGDRFVRACASDAFERLAGALGIPEVEAILRPTTVA